MKWLLTAIALVMCWPAFAETCVTPDALKAAVEMVPGNAYVETVEGPEAKELIRLFNAEPPPSDVKADQVLTFANMRQPAVLLVFFSNGCAQEKKGGLHVEKYLEMREKAKGQAS